LQAAAPTRQDFDLRWLQPCLQVEPVELHAAVPFLESRSYSLQLINSGSVSVAYNVKYDVNESCREPGTGILDTPWLSVAPLSGAIPAGGIGSLQVQLDGTQFPGPG